MLNLRGIRMTGNVLKEIEENISVYEEQGLELIPLSLVKYWISVLGKENEQLKKEAEEYNENAMSYQTLYEQQLETIHRLNQNIDELMSVNVEKELLEENKQLKSFIKKLTNHNGEIVLINGYGYTKSYVEKLLNEKELEE